jgi:hypothetical protein
MQRRIQTISITGALLAFSAIAAPNVMACSTPGVSGWKPPMMAPHVAGLLASLARTARPSAATMPAPGSAPIVGLWFIQFSSGGYIVDQAFDVWHSDGTEILNDYTNPIEDNVCLGVWAQSGQTYKLKHPSWTFDGSGNLTGTAIIGETVTVDAEAMTFTGSYTTDLFDLSGNPVGQYFGTVNATRVMPD